MRLGEIIQGDNINREGRRAWQNHGSQRDWNHVRGDIANTQRKNEGLRKAREDVCQAQGRGS